ncbi:MAG TPA: periplasmic heavy metal sensor [Candidatus Binatia bacterium]|jgi:uncharacterized membrane protein
MNKTLKLVFLISIVLNVLLVGVLLGELPNRFDRRPLPQERIAAAAKQLPESERPRFESKMEQMRKEVQPLRDQLQEARQETLRVFAAEPFDESAFDRQVSKVAQLRVQLFMRMAESMKAIAKELPAEQRQALARAFERPPSRQ